MSLAGCNAPILKYVNAARRPSDECKYWDAREFHPLNIISNANLRKIYNHFEIILEQYSLLWCHQLLSLSIQNIKPSIVSAASLDLFFG
jgi:hypothetical protein